MSYISPKEKFLARYGSYDHVDRMIGSSDDIDHVIAQHVDLHPDHEKILAKSNDWQIHESLANNTSNPELLDRYSKSNDDLIRTALVYNPHAQANHLDSVLDKVGKHEQHIVSSLVFHPNTSKKTLQAIINGKHHGSEYSRDVAYRRLKNGEYKE